MSTLEMQSMVKTLLEIPETDTSSDGLISAYLLMAEKEILSWRFSYAASTPETVPSEYEMTCVMAVVAGFSQGGAEGQTQHNENGINRVFRYADMLSYIRSHVIPICKVT